MVFIDASKFTNAYSIRGQYKQKESKIELKANLIKNGKIVKSYSIKELSKEQVIEKLITTEISEIISHNNR